MPQEHTTATTESPKHDSAAHGQHRQHQGGTPLGWFYLDLYGAALALALR